MYLLLAATAWAEEPSEEEKEKEVAELRERVRILEKAVDDLRGTSGTSETEIPLDLETRINGYGAVTLSSDEEDRVLAFSLDDMVFRYTANLDRKISFSTEFAIKSEERKVSLELETMEVVVSPKPGFQLDAGAFHNPISPFAVAAAQGGYRYLPVELPASLVTGEGEQFLPINQIGAQFRGTVPLGFWQFSYLAAVTNGRSSFVDGVVAAGDLNWFKAVSGRVALQAPSGLQFGLSGYYDRVQPVDDAEKSLGDFGEAIGGASIWWEGGPVELRSEGYLTVHTDEAESYLNGSAFVVLGVPIQRATPYVVADVVFKDEDDPVYKLYDLGENEIEGVVGVRYELGLHLAVKGQVGFAVEPEEDEEYSEIVPGVYLQLAAGF